MASVVRKGELYPIAPGERLPMGMVARLTRACWTGEHRPPVAGEWYLSGAEVEAYRSSHDMTSAFHIAELMVGESVVRWRKA